MVGGELSFPRIKCLAEWPSKANFTIEKFSMSTQVEILNLWPIKVAPLQQIETGAS